MSLMYGGEKPQLELDNAAETSFCKSFERLPTRSEGLVRLFERPAYYSAHGEDALLIASIVYNTTNAIKFLGSKSKQWPNGLPSVTLNMSAAKNFLREALTARQMRVEIYAQEGSSKTGGNWILARQASPGNISALEDLLFTNHDLLSSPVVLALTIAIKEGSRTVGAAFADVSSRELGVAEFADNDLFSNTESLIIQLSVKECVIKADDKRTDYDLAKIRTMLERCGVIMTEVRASHFSSKNIEQDLTRLLLERPAASTIPQLSFPLCMNSLSALISDLSLLTDPANHGAFSIRTHDLSQHMKLDASALSALNLLPNPNDVGSKNSSLLGLLNRCRTAPGQRLLAVWLKQPLVNLHEIERRQNLVEIFVEDADTRRTLQTDFLKPFPDLSRLSKRLQRRISSLEEVVRIYQAVLRIPGLIAAIEAAEVISDRYKDLLKEFFLKDLQSYSELLGPLQELVESTIDLEEMSSHNYVIKPDFDEELQNLKEKLIDARDALDAEHQRVGRELGLDTDKKLHLENQQQYGYCLRVTKAESSVIRGKNGYVEYGTQKSGTYFTTPAMKRAASDYAEFTKAYEKTQNGLVKEVVEICATYIPVLENLDSLIAKLDVIVSFADISVSAPIPYVKPKVLQRGGGDYILKEARHPCLEVQDDITFIANDVELARDQSEFQIITGPNAGGKSTYIRQIGVIALMAQIGCFVPALEAQLPIFDCILARVGAGDSQLKGISTFMAEMLETATILRSATKDSLIIIDELGRGTSTYDGFGLAWAISEHIVKEIRAFTLFATHFHELTALAQQTPHVRNLQVKALIKERGTGNAQDRDITLLYKVEDGVAGQSYGISIAELANFPESVVRMAKRKAEELEDFGDDATEVPQTIFTKHSRQEVEAGTALVAEYLSAWRSHLPEKKEDLTEEAEWKALREVGEEFRARIEASPYCRQLLDEF